MLLGRHYLSSKQNVEMVDRLREYYAASKEDALDDKENVQPLLPIEQPIKCIESPMSAEEGGEMVKTTEKVVTPPIQPPSEPHTLGGPALENSLPIQGSPMRARSKSVADRVKEEMENRLNQGTYSETCHQALKCLLTR